MNTINIKLTKSIDIKSIKYEIDRINTKYFFDMFLIEEKGNVVTISYEGEIIRVFRLTKDEIEIEQGGLNWYYWVSSIFTNNLFLSFCDDNNDGSVRNYYTFLDFMQNVVANKNPISRKYVLYSSSLECPIPFKYVSDEIASSFIEGVDKELSKQLSKNIQN